MSLPALLQSMWIRLVGKDVALAGDREMELFYRLEKAGLAAVDESETHLYLEVKHGKEHDILYELLCENAGYSVYSKEMFEDAAEKLKSWEFWNCRPAADGKSYISFFCSNITEEILKKEGKIFRKMLLPFEQGITGGVAGWRLAFRLSGLWRNICLPVL